MRRTSPGKHRDAQHMEAYPQPPSLYGQPRQPYTPPDHPPYPDEVLNALPPIGGKRVGSEFVKALRRIQGTLARHNS
ncbi:MAG TPA: hypothetical protein VH540_19820 [Ktedonobacterales bacterium]